MVAFHLVKGESWLVAAQRRFEKPVVRIGGELKLIREGLSPRVSVQTPLST